MDPVLDRVVGTISRYNMLQPGDRVGVAVSGGLDSVCLLYALRELSDRFGISLTAVHLNHHLRGAESDEDADFVQALSGELKIPFVGADENVATVHDNLEQAGRNARRKFFSGLIDSGCVDRVATGHTMSDQAETVLYRLFRGAGTSGLAGILPVAGEGVIRPFLDCERAEIESFARKRGLHWREDRTNQDRRFARNRIRHGLLPVIAETYNPSISSVLAGMAEVARTEEHFWSGQARAAFDRVGVEQGGLVLLNVDQLLLEHRAVQRRVIRHSILLTKGTLRSIGFDHVEQVLALSHAAGGSGAAELPGVKVQRSFNWLRFAAGQTANKQYEVAVEPPMEVLLPEGQRIIVNVVASSAVHQSNRYNELSFLDVDRLRGSLTLRNWRPGDRYSPRGSDEKIKHLFQRARIPFWERQSWPIMTSGGKVVWARRFGADIEVTADASTRTLLCIREEPGGDSPESNRR